jgi:hypothetical protein
MPSGPLTSLSLMLMILPRLLPAFASRPLSLTFTKRFGWTPHPTAVRSCHAKRPGFRKWQNLTALTRDKALRVRIQKALAIDYLRNDLRMLGARSVGPIDMCGHVMSVARVGPPVSARKATARILSGHIDRRSRDPARSMQQTAITQSAFLSTSLVCFSVRTPRAASAGCAAACVGRGCGEPEVCRTDAREVGRAPYCAQGSFTVRMLRWRPSKRRNQLY